MKKSLLIITGMLFVLVMTTMSTYAADQLPSAPVSYVPANGTVGAPITLNALVYNGEKVDATVTLTFSVPGSTASAAPIIIGTANGSIAAQSAKTVSVAWTMPKDATIVTAIVTAAVNAKKQSLPSLLGVIGTVTVGNMPVPLISGLSFPGSVQINTWGGPFFAKVETFRTKQSVYFVQLRDSAKNTLSSSTDQAFNHPMNYVTLVYATVGAALFASQPVFYIVAILIFLFLLRFIVNLIF